MATKPLIVAAAALLLPMSAHAADRQFVPGMTNGPAGTNPPYSAAVVAGNTVYVAGTTDGAVPGDTAAMAAKRVLDNIKRNVEAAGLTMDDLVWVQVFSSNLADYADFNTVYRGYFKGPMPARAFLGVDHLLGGAKFEVMGIAVKR
jgi:2-iminobutanoate/2-iminopropanoate deaminase